MAETRALEIRWYYIASYVPHTAPQKISRGEAIAQFGLLVVVHVEGLFAASAAHSLCLNFNGCFVLIGSEAGIDQVAEQMREARTQPERAANGDGREDGR